MNLNPLIEINKYVTELRVKYRTYVIGFHVNDVRDFYDICFGPWIIMVYAGLGQFQITKRLLLLLLFLDKMTYYFYFFLIDRNRSTIVFVNTHWIKGL